MKVGYLVLVNINVSCSKLVISFSILFMVIRIYLFFLNVGCNNVWNFFDDIVCICFWNMCLIILLCFLEKIGLLNEVSDILIVFFLMVCFKFINFLGLMVSCVIVFIILLLIIGCMCFFSMVLV